MVVSPGKKFEQDFQQSVPEHVYCYRLRDCGGWSGGELRFTPSNHCDFFIFFPPHLLAVECKSTNGTSIRFDALREVQKAGLITAELRNVKAGVLIEWRKGPHQVVWVPIGAWTRREAESEKKSMNRTEALEIGRLVPSKQKISRYWIDVLSLLKGE